MLLWNPDALCLAQGPLEYHLDPPREIIQLPRKIPIVEFICHENQMFLKLTGQRRIRPAPRR